MNISKTKKLTTISMLCALAYAAATVGRIPLVLFLKYDPKDVIIAIGGIAFWADYFACCNGDCFCRGNVYDQRNGSFRLYYEHHFKLFLRVYCCICLQEETGIVRCCFGASVRLGLSGCSNDALELFDCSALYGVSAGSCCGTAATSIFTLQFN